MYGNENNLYVHNFEFDMRFFIIYNVVLNIEILCVLGGLAFGGSGNVKNVTKLLAKGYC